MLLSFRRKSYWAAAVAAAGVLLCAAPAVDARECPGEHCVGVRPGDEILLVSVRPLGCSTDESKFAERIHVERFQQQPGGGQAWERASLDDFLASVQPDMPTVVFAHGNRVENNEVRPRGLWVYRRLVQCRGDDRPFRFVLYSWPADQIKGLIRDARTKAARAIPAGYQLAWLLNQTPAEAEVGLLGYSFGARVQNTAAHLLAGGRVGRVALAGCGGADESVVVDRRVAAVYVAPALDADWLCPGHFHGRSLDTIDTMLVTANEVDPAMRFFRFLNLKKCPQSMGYSGPTCLPRGAGDRVRVINVREAVGRTHDMCTYMRVGGLMRNAWRRLLHADEPAVASKATTTR